MYEKVGRLKPDSVNNQVRVIIDGQGDIGTISRGDLVGYCPVLSLDRCCHPMRLTFLSRPGE